MTAMTLLEAAKEAAGQGDTVKAGVMAMYAERSDILAAMTFEGIMGGAVKFTQEGDLPTTAFRKINEGFTPNNGSLNPQVESLFAAGGDLDVDTFILDTQGEGVRARHVGMKSKALAVGITDAILKGDNSTDPSQFDGFQKRATGGQLIDNGTTSGGAALSLKKLDELIDSVDGPTHLIMNRAMRRKFQAAMRSSTSGVGSNVMLTTDPFGKPQLSYNNLPILVGYPQNKNTRILPFTEAAYSGGATASSIYCVNFGADAVRGINNPGMQVRDLGELQDTPAKRTRVTWNVGLLVPSEFYLARLCYIGDLDIAA